MALKSEWLATFLAVVESGSFTDGAQRIHRTQSAVSMQIQQLERHAGQPLLVRHRQSVVPTATGERLIPHARRVVESLADVSQCLAVTPARGQLRIGVPEEYATGPLTTVLARFQRAQPEVELIVCCGPSPDIADMMAAGNLDLGILIADQQPVHGEVIGYDPTDWLVGVGMEWTPDEPLPLVLFDHDCWWRQWAIDAVQQAGLEWRVAYTSHSVSGVGSAIRAGLGIGVLGKSTAPAETVPASNVMALPTLPGSHLVLRILSHQAPGVWDMAATVRRAFATHHD
ncbi:LysR family transcriptional regulator [Aidingimonas lacisalsi]|uniref:LysR family transcriptional regulator n=1 Tax=Aidingimonas lacisalsi TaxID=2604086 RepID=UPI0011D26090|nr:LysR family transcriptional regulator [Aidingimonas lacisalsi]